MLQHNFSCTFAKKNNMKHIFLGFIICIGSLTVCAQELNIENNPVIKYLRKNKITTKNVVGIKPESKSLLNKEFKNLPYLEVYTSPGVQVKYPGQDGKLVSSFFEPDERSVIPMTVETETVDGTVNILRRFFHCTSLDGSQISYELMEHPEKYYVLLFWKKSNSKSVINILKKWDDYAIKNTKIKLILINLD